MRGSRGMRAGREREREREREGDEERSDLVMLGESRQRRRFLQPGLVKDTH